MVGVVLHLFDLFCLGAPETVIGFDAGIRGCLGIAELIAERDGILRIDVEYLQGMQEKGRVTIELPDLLAGGVLSTDAVDLVFGEHTLQIETFDCLVHHVVSIARDDGCLDVVLLEILLDLGPTSIHTAFRDV